jgi:hypothetical protein
MKRPGLPLSARTVVAVVWALTAILASTVTSWAVSVVASEEDAPRTRVLTEADVARALEQQSTAQTAGPSPTATPTEASAPTPTPDAPAESPSPTPKPAHKPTATSAPAPPPTPAPPAAPPAATEVVRILDVTGGRMWAGCVGSVFRLISAQPTWGWSVEVGHSGSDGGEVTFRRDGSESQLHATCQAGIPTQEPGDGGD